MGAQQSSISDLSSNELLQRFVKPIRIDREDEFWMDLVTYNLAIPSSKSDCKLLKENILSLCGSLVTGNKASGNFTTLACIAIFYIREMMTNSDALDATLYQKCQNVLFIIQCCCEYFIENLSEDEIIANFNTLPSFDGQPTILEEFLLALSEVISFLEVNESTYYMHLEVVTIYLILLCSRMYEPQVNNNSKIYLIFMNSKCSSNATMVVRTLFHNYIKDEDVPPHDQGLVGWAASGIWSLLGGGGASKTVAKQDTTPHNQLSPLSSHSLLLLLVFSFQFTKEHNPYRAAVFQCKPGRKTEAENVDQERSFPLNFKRLYNAISRDLHNDETVLLLYLMLHKNPSFLRYALHRKDLPNLVIPILEVLYNAEYKNAHHIYMALIVVLIFTQEDDFNAAVHQIPTTNVTWYKEKKLTDISLGSLLVLIVLRTIQYNMAKMRDKYLHTNCLASLANMSSTFKSLHSAVTQKFISLFQQLTKRHSKLSEKLKQQDSSHEEELADLAVLEEIIHMMIEILNACLCDNMEENSNLVHALLRNKELFQTFHTNPRFQDIIQNVDSIMTYFGSRVDEHSHVDSAEQIVAIIQEATLNWPKDQIKKFPQLKFKYMEEEAAEEFFIPYIWSIVYRTSYLHWNNNKITLFHVNPT